MPELPEVETVVRKLRPKILQSTCKKIELFDQKLRSPEESLGNCTITEVERLGKEILLGFANKKNKTRYFLTIHLRMTGRLLLNSLQNHKSGALDHLDIYESEAYLQNKIIRVKAVNHTKHIRAAFHLSNGILYFYDVRRFGTFRWHRDKPVLPNTVIDPMVSQLTKEVFGNIISSCPNSSVKSFLMRQDKIVGIGNIYASEILYEAGIHPERLCKTLIKKEVSQLIVAIPKILSAAIQHNGTTFSDFQHDDAEIGSFQNYVSTYKREGQPCKSCAGKITKITQQQRSTYFCPRCQK